MSNKDKLLDKIRDVYCGLSPENLCCDGELPLYLVKKREKQLRAELKKLFKEFGREVSEFEAYNLPER